MPFGKRFQECFLVILSSLLFSFTSPLFATQNDSLATTHNRPVLGLALSGGGAKGFAHIGVLKVMEEAGLQADVVSGVSMGSIIGGLYSIGFTATELESIAVSIDWIEIFNDTPARNEMAMEQKFYDARYVLSLPFDHWNIQLPSGMIAGHKVNKLLTSLTWRVHHLTDFHDFARPFSCVATNLETGEAIVLDEGYLPSAMRASMAIPSIFTPVTYDGITCIDGFVVRNLPAEDVIELGADIVIGVDVGAPLKDADQLSNFVDVLNQTISFQGTEEVRRQRDLCDLLIVPDVEDVFIGDFQHVREIIQLGEDAAREHFSELVALADSLNSIGAPPIYSIPIAQDSVYVSEMEIFGLENTSDRVLTGQMNLRLPGWTTREEIEHDIDRIYSSLFFESVGYRLLPTPSGSLLQLFVEERNTDLIRVGFHYDSRTKAAMLLNLTVFNLGLQGSLTNIDFRLGDYNFHNINYLYATGVRPKVGIQLEIHSEIHDNLFSVQPGTFVSSRVEMDYTDFLVGSLYSSTSVIAAGLRYSETRIDYNNLPQDHGLDLLEFDHRWFASMVLIYDTRNRLYFTTSGLYLAAIYNYTMWAYDRDDDQSLSEIECELYLPITSRYTLIGRFASFILDGVDLHPMQSFSVGGYDYLFGTEPDEFQGRSFRVYKLGIQWELLPKRFVRFEFAGGRIGQYFSDPGITETGMALTVGAVTPIGPIQYIIQSGRHSSTLLRVGYMF